MKKTVIWLFKAVVAFTLAFALMCGFSYFYDNTPTHFDNTTNATDYKYASHSFYSIATEGIAFGKVNDDGFNNEEDLTENKIDILLMGSSHEQGFNVMTSQTTASQLNQLFDGEYYTYSIAQASQTLPYFVRNLDSALELYQPKDYVLFEVQSILIHQDIAQQALNNTLARLPSATGFSATLQKVPYLKTAYHQVSDYMALKNADTVSDNTEYSKITAEYEATLDALMQKIEDVCKKYSVTPIIYFHPHLSVNNDKTVTLLNISTPLSEVQEFYDYYKISCENHGIIFVDMSEDFIKNYQENYILPHGYTNTKIGDGHLNADGHRIIAERLKETIEEKAVTQ